MFLVTCLSPRERFLNHSPTLLPHSHPPTYSPCYTPSLYSFVRFFGCRFIFSFTLFVCLYSFPSTQIAFQSFISSVVCCVSFPALPPLSRALLCRRSSARLRQKFPSDASHHRSSSPSLMKLTSQTPVVASVSGRVGVQTMSIKSVVTLLFNHWSRRDISCELPAV